MILPRGCCTWPPVRLSVELGAGSRVLDYRTSPDGLRVVYRADPEIGLFELFSTSIHGPRGQVKLSRPASAGADVDAYAISADSSTVGFLAPRAAAGETALFLQPIRSPQKPFEVPGPGSVRAFELRRDGNRVVYVADQETPGVGELFTLRRERPGVLPR